ncbi:MAG: ANTAR domain-containing protein [Streptosporangiaceae bacterium]
MSAEEVPEEPELVRRLDGVADDLGALAKVLGEEEDLGRVLQRSVEQVTRGVPGADMASVTVMRGDRGETVASSEERVWAIDSDQYAAGDGPCLEAARTREIVRVGVEEARRRWPEFARCARAAGVESYLSCPLIIGEEFVGSLNLYSEKPHGFGDLDVALLRVYMTAAVAAIASTRRLAEARKLAEGLRTAMESRTVIDQARGVLMALRGISAEQALAELSRQSQNTNVKLRVIAARVLESVRRLDQ